MMALRTQQIENGFAYLNNAKKAKRKSHKRWKQEFNRKLRRKMKGDIDFVPVVKQKNGWEY